MNANDDTTGGRAIGEGERGDGELSSRELGERIILIESMMRAGRRTTEYWGWNFLLWGVAMLIAVVWSSFITVGRQLAWPVTMIFAFLLTIAVARARLRNQPRSEKSRGIRAIWMAVGLGIFVFAFPVTYSGHFEQHAFIAAIEVLLGVAHIASGMMLRWPTQVAVGGVWWAAAIVSCFVSGNGVAIAYMAATLICNIGFGIYLMVRESRDKAREHAAQVQHA